MRVSQALAKGRIPVDDAIASIVHPIGTSEYSYRYYGNIGYDEPYVLLSELKQTPLWRFRFHFLKMSLP